MSAPYAPFGQPILLCHYVRGFLLKQFRLQQVAHAQPTARHFVFVRGPDPARRRADLLAPARAFRCFVQLP